VYFYPENKEQHEQNTESEFEEESISCDDTIQHRSEELQEDTDPTFEQLLYFYIKHQIIPLVKH